MVCLCSVSEQANEGIVIVGKVLKFVTSPYSDPLHEIFAKYDAGLLFAVEWMLRGRNVCLTVGCVRGDDDFGGDISRTAVAGPVGLAP